MVRNKKGGSGHKKQASRHAKNPTRNYKLRKPTEHGEIIARVTKLFGHGMVEVICNDGIIRLCIVRKKFKGRNKRDNQICLHTYVLVGIRSYEVVSQGKKSKVDLLEVYSDDHKTQLERGGHIHNCMKNMGCLEKQSGTILFEKGSTISIENMDVEINIDDI